MKIIQLALVAGFSTVLILPAGAQQAETINGPAVAPSVSPAPSPFHRREHKWHGRRNWVRHKERREERREQRREQRNNGNVSRTQSQARANPNNTTLQPGATSQPSPE